MYCVWSLTEPEDGEDVEESDFDGGTRSRDVLEGDIEDKAMMADNV